MAQGPAETGSDGGYQPDVFHPLSIQTCVQGKEGTHQSMRAFHTRCVLFIEGSLIYLLLMCIYVLKSTSHQPPQLYLESLRIETQP